jgi:hypothetical protein
MKMHGMGLFKLISNKNELKGRKKKRTHKGTRMVIPPQRRSPHKPSIKLSNQSTPSIRHERTKNTLPPPRPDRTQA